MGMIYSCKLNKFFERYPDWKTPEEAWRAQQLKCDNKYEDISPNVIWVNSII